jgi:ribosome-binding factor A
MADRITRISEEVKKEISNIIQNEIKDPRLPNLVSIIACNVTKDLSHAKVFISVLGSEEEKKNAIMALKSAAGFIRRELGHRVKLRATPEIHFELDTSIEHGMYINKLLDEAKKEYKE